MNHSPDDNAPLPPLNRKARALHTEILALLQQMLDMRADSPLDPLFIRCYRRALNLFDAYQQEIIAASDYRVTCAKNCRLCCYHWVADVYSFEACIISEHIKKHMPEHIAPILETLRDDARHMQLLDDALDDRVLMDAPPGYLQTHDRDDLLLEGFYQLRRSCPLLDARGACSIYELRPMSCRSYLSFSDPLLCDPDTIYYREVQTCLCTVENDADELLEELHDRYDHSDYDSSLRTLLPSYLTGHRDCIFKRVI